MIITKFDIEGLLLFEPRIYKDSRGYFFESFNDIIQKELGHYNFVQDNQSCSEKNVLRGLHFQNPPFEQGKLVRVVSGSVQDIAVDLRKSSATFGKYISIELSASNHKILWIPPGFAHGFLSLQDNTVFLYKCTNPYNSDAESGLNWNDPTLGINWSSRNVKVSSKDQELPDLKNLISPF